MKTKLTITIPVWLDKICVWPVVAYRRRKYGYDFRRISLGEGKFTIVDPADYYRFNIFNWCPRDQGSNIYAVRPICTPDRITFVSLHREIMGNPKGLVVDHRNCVGLDNRRDNLRTATQSQNTCNCRKRANTTSRFMGVYFNKAKGLWASSIKSHGKRIWLGYFKSEVEAARAYDRAAIKYHGEFARLNFPREDYINEISASNSK
jgi:hypothetical protein